MRLGLALGYWGRGPSPDHLPLAQEAERLLMARMGYEEEARRVQELFLSGRTEEAVRAVPDAFADGISLVGPRERIAERLQLWRKGLVTDLLALAPDPASLRVLAELNS
ncbi:hypothetical protein GCM10009535_51740 [Streptomyces thermocarboxydovorans]|uniref:Luciferase-like domain-containing protein n=2 Tax=Streptomyces thermocarboxydovorans TaxID=59298 RepID=A0ABP3SVH6_9ACTN